MESNAGYRRSRRLAQPEDGRWSGVMGQVGVRASRRKDGQMITLSANIEGSTGSPAARASGQPRSRPRPGGRTVPGRWRAVRGATVPRHRSVSRLPFCSRSRRATRTGRARSWSSHSLVIAVGADAVGLVPANPRGRRAQVHRAVPTADALLQGLRAQPGDRRPEGCAEASESAHGAS